MLDARRFQVRYAHNVGLGAFIKICMFEHLYKISVADIQIHLIYALHQTRNKRREKKRTNDEEKRTKGLSDYVGEAKLKLCTQTDHFCE